MSCSKLKEIAIIGAGGFGREVRWLIERINQIVPTWNFIGFYDDAYDTSQTVSDWILGPVSDLIDRQESLSVVCAIGSPIVRKRVIDSVAGNIHLSFPSLIDPAAIVGESCAVSEGSIICANTVVTTDVKIGAHVHINLNCTVGHNAVIGDFSTVYPSVSISGDTILGTVCEFGTNSTILQRLKIANQTRVGAGAVVTKDIEEPNYTYVGVPARKLIPR